MYDLSCGVLLGAMNLPSWDINEGVPAMIFYLLYNTCWIEELSSLEHDWLSVKDINCFVEFLSH